MSSLNAERPRLHVSTPNDCVTCSMQSWAVPFPSRVSPLSMHGPFLYTNTLRLCDSVAVLPASASVWIRAQSHSPWTPLFPPYRTLALATLLSPA